MFRRVLRVVLELLRVGNAIAIHVNLPDRLMISTPLSLIIVTHPFSSFPSTRNRCREPSLMSTSASGHGSTVASTHPPSYRISSRVPGLCRGLLAGTTVNGVGSTVSSLSDPSRRTTT